MKGNMIIALLRDNRVMESGGKNRIWKSDGTVSKWVNKKLKKSICMDELIRNQIWIDKKLKNQTRELTILLNFIWNYELYFLVSSNSQREMIWIFLRMITKNWI